MVSRNMKVGGSAIDLPGRPYGTQFIQAGLLYPYVTSANPYRCPADDSTFPYTGAAGQPRVRSVAMNCWLNPYSWPNPKEDKSWNAIKGYGGSSKAQRVFRKLNNLSPSPGPSQTWVLVDENPASIDDGYFVCDLAQDAWVNVPASYHNGACGFSFADGHAEIHRWRDGKAITFNDYNYGNNNGSPAVTLSSSDLQDDLNWLKLASTTFQ
jgi:prepilin-type processing-associated H-X9-DG protein